MPNVALAFVGLASGWAIAAAFGKIAPKTEKYFKGLLCACLIVAGLTALFITVGEPHHWPHAFDVEEAIIEERWCAVSLWMTAGLAVYTYRKPIKQFLVDLTDLTLKPPAGGPAAPQEMRQLPLGSRADQAADDGAAPQAGNAGVSRYLPLSLPWSIEAGIFATIIIVAILALNPKMLQGLTSFKAGVIEAHFATAGPILQKGQVAVTDANRKSVFKNWTEFYVYDEGRTRIYDDNADGQEFPRSFASDYFDTQLRPVFSILYSREKSYHKFNFENFGKLQNLSMRFANLIETNLDPSKKGPTDHASETQIAILKKITLEILVFKCSVDVPDLPDIKRECDNNPSLATAKCWISSWYAPPPQPCEPMTYPEAIIEVEKHYKQLPDPKTAENIWHPYIIQAVADLLGRAMGSSERANFLEVTTSLLEKDGRICKTCVFPDPGKMSLVYAAVEAKVESEQPWPFEHMFQQVSDLLADTGKIVDADHLPRATRALERRNRLIDLSLGLQLFYQRALTGQRFAPAQLQSWSEWLRETRAALSILEEAGGGDEQFLEAGERKAWEDARTIIEQDGAVVQDAATAAALSSVLLPALGGGTTSADCLKARALFDFAADRNIDRFYAGLEFDPDEKATYQGLIEQMKARIESECD